MERPLPPRSVSVKSIPTIYRFQDFIGKSDEEIKTRMSRSIYIEDLHNLKRNFDLLKRILSFKQCDKLYSKNYQCLTFIESELKDYENVTLSLVDDYQNKDRSSLDFSVFQKTTGEIPFSYVLWNPILQETQHVSLYTMAKTLYPSTTAYNQISKETLKRIEEIVHHLAMKYQGNSAIYKTMVVSDYLQDFVQYVDADNISAGILGTYITDSFGRDITIPLTVNPETVLFEHFGVCAGIGNATTLLLNNPSFNVWTRSMYGDNHVWNVVMLDDGQYYFVDNTWCITRNKHQYSESLKAASFSSDYLFFGSETAKQIGHHNPATLCPTLSENDLNSNLYEPTPMELCKTLKLQDYRPPVFPSRLQK